MGERIGAPAGCTAAWMLPPGVVAGIFPGTAAAAGRQGKPALRACRLVPLMRVPYSPAEMKQAAKRLGGDGRDVSKGRNPVL